MKLLTISLVWLAAVSLASGDVTDLEWPRDIVIAGKGKVTVYQPQLESFEGNSLEGLAAVSVDLDDRDEPVFGAVLLRARVETDRETRTVDVVDVKVPEVRFPEATPDQLDKLTGLIETHFTQADLTLSLDQLLTSLDLIEEQEKDGPLETNPPGVVFVTAPTALISIDGEPQLRPTEGDASVMRVLNTPAFVVLDTKSGRYFIRGGGRWFSAAALDGPWGVIEGAPENVAMVAAKEPEDAAAAVADKKPPAVMVVTEPTELIETDGEPSYTPLKGTNLLYVSNTERDVFLHIASNTPYILLSGRWFVAEKLAGPWSFVASDALPADFAKIPEGSDKGDVLAFVAGTEVAREAVLDTAIPQTAAIKRTEAKVTVVYEGAPQFTVVQGSTVQYAANTMFAVLKVGERYYCCHDGVWFESHSPTGPWVVCVVVPSVIYTLPPSCPVYHVRYVRVYSYTPDVVYVGYTPGYVGCYVYRGTVVYGTGYVYHGYCGARVWAPRPRTFGVAVAYNPRTGNWGVRAGVGGRYGFVGVGRRGGGWDRDIDIDVDIDRDVTVKNKNETSFERNDNRSRNVYDRRGDVAGRDRGSRGGDGPGRQGDGRRDARPGEAGRGPGGGSATTQPARPSGGAGRGNDHFADRGGNVYRKGADGSWQKRDSGSWQNVDRAGAGGSSPRSGSGASGSGRPSGAGTSRPSSGAGTGRPSSGAGSSRPSSSYGSKDLNRMQKSRDRGASRTRSSGRSRGGGGRRGGRRG